MKKRLACFLLTTAAALALCGCGSMFEREYFKASDYTPTAQSGSLTGEKTAVGTFAELKQLLLEMVAAGETERSVVFDPAYPGSTADDLDSACWQVRTQDALCAYCVENINYDLNQIVTYYEADIYVSYSSMAQDLDSIVHMQYSTGIDDIIKDAIREGRNRLVILIGRSSYSAESMELLVSRVYRGDPGIAPREPSVSVNLYSGTGMQRLYDISLSYGLSSEELERRKAEMAALDPFAGLDTERMSELEKALAACVYLTETCQYLPEPQANSIYAALVGGQSGSQGMALAYVELCNRLGLDCRLVSGQRNWSDHYWNIIGIDGDYYHVDPAACAESGLEAGFLLRDENMWGDYRWDMGAYPSCTGELSYRTPAGADNPGNGPEGEEPGTEPPDETDPGGEEPGGENPGEGGSGEEPGGQEPPGGEEPGGEEPPEGENPGGEEPPEEETPGEGSDEDEP